MKQIAAICALNLCWIASSAGSLHAQSGYTITTPGRPPTYVNPTPGGGYTVMTPGQLPTYVNPNPGGGYTVMTPGQLPTYVTPNPGIARQDIYNSLVNRRNPLLGY
jgi:hypothetical protein